MSGDDVDGILLVNCVKHGSFYPEGEKCCACVSAALRAENERLKIQFHEYAEESIEQDIEIERRDARIAELEAALTGLLTELTPPWQQFITDINAAGEPAPAGIALAFERARAAIKGDAGDNEG